MDTHMRKMTNQTRVDAIAAHTKHERAMFVRAIGRYMLLGTAIVTGVSCADPSAPPAPQPPIGEVLASVAVDPTAVILAVGDSILITPSAKNIFGDSLPIGSGTPIVWKSSAVRTLSVDSNGVLRALKATTEDEFITITASWAYNGVTRSATVLANISQTRQPVAGIRVISQDSARGGWVSPFAEPYSGVSVITVDANGQRIGMPRVPLTLQDSMQASSVSQVFLGRIGVQVGAGQYVIASRAIGKFWLRAQSNVYGVTMRDSLEFTGLYAATADIAILQDSLSSALISASSGHEVFVQPCGIVRFKNTSKTPIDIVFSDSATATKCVTADQIGNILNLRTNQTVIRKFPNVRTVQWTVRDPATGSVFTRVSGNITMKVP